MAKCIAKDTEFYFTEPEREIACSRSGYKLSKFWYWNKDGNLDAFICSRHASMWLQAHPVKGDLTQRIRERMRQLTAHKGATDHISTEVAAEIVVSSAEGHGTPMCTVDAIANSGKIYYSPINQSEYKECEYVNGHFKCSAQHGHKGNHIMFHNS